MDCIEKYFYLTPYQKEKFLLFKEYFTDWNNKINLISRKDVDFFCLKHVLHSLAIAKYADLDETKVLDVGTGGGLPGIPLAIMFPKAEFLLIDSVGKKINAVNDIIHKLDLKNVTALKVRSNELKGKYDFIVARAVTHFPKFFYDVKHLLRSGHISNRKNGIIYIKGGDFKEEISQFKTKISIDKISDSFAEEFFETKKIIHYKF